MKIAVESPQKQQQMSGTESHDGLLCKFSNLHSLRRGEKKTPGRGDEKISSVKSVPEENKHIKIL